MIDYRKLDVLKQTLDSYRPLPAEIVNNLHEDLVLRWTYSSNVVGTAFKPYWHALGIKP